jgi:hypothetical protein
MLLGSLGFHFFLSSLSLFFLHFLSFFLSFFFSFQFLASGLTVRLCPLPKLLLQSEQPGQSRFYKEERLPWQGDVRSMSEKPKLQELRTEAILNNQSTVGGKG